MIAGLHAVRDKSRSELFGPITQLSIRPHTIVGNDKPIVTETLHAVIEVAAQRAADPR